MDDYNPEKLIVALRPADEDMTMMELDDEDPIIVTMIGKKGYLLSLVTALASVIEED